VSPELLLTQALNGLAFAMLLFLVAAGLTLIFGLMDVLNLAHGSFFMLGAYLGLTFVRTLGSFWLALVLVPPLVALLGLLVERFLLRRLYGRPGHLDHVLLTLGLLFILADMVHWQWGAAIQSLHPPPGLDGTTLILGSSFPVYRLFVIGFGLVLALALWLLLDRTRWGAVIRAGVHDRQMVQNLGINIDAVYSGAFAFGCGLAALSGVVGAPIVGLYLGLDADVLILALIVIVIGGLGSFAGSFLGSLLVGQADTFGRALLPEFSMFLSFGVMALVLLFRPGGLLGRVRL